jgi:hypothetical protein
LFVAYQLILYSNRVISWVVQGGSSNHLPILLQIESERKNPLAPFKFNHSWLDDEDSKALVIKNWIHYANNNEDTTMKLFIDNLKSVKRQVAKWA